MTYNQLLTFFTQKQGRILKLEQSRCLEINGLLLDSALDVTVCGTPVAKCCRGGPLQVNKIQSNQNQKLTDMGSTECNFKKRNFTGLHENVLFFSYLFLFCFNQLFNTCHVKGFFVVQHTLLLLSTYILYQQMLDKELK